MTRPPADRAAWTLRRTLLLFLIMAACSDRSAPTGPAGPQPPQAATAVRSAITPSAVLLTEQGATRRLVAVGYDVDGNQTDVDVTWRSSDESVAVVAADGTLTARAALGSAQVVAEAGALATPPVLVVVAQPVQGAVLVDDEQVVSGPVGVSPDEEYGIGWRYSVRLRGVDDVAPGTILLASGGTPIAGRVVAVSAAGAELDVTLELLPLPELFTQLVIDETIPLDANDAQLDASLVQDYALQRGLAGEIILTPRAGARPWSAAPFAAGVTAETGKFELGPFTCETSGSMPELDLPKPKLKFQNRLGLQIRYDGVFERLAVVGDVDASFGYRPVFKAAFEGSVDCNATPFRIPIPLGALGPAFSAIVPVGVGMKLEGKITLAEIGFDVSASAGATVTLGVDCPGGSACAPLTSFEPRPPEHAFELIAPSSVTDQLQLELGGTAYVLAKLAYGPPAFESLQFEVLEGKAGIKQSVDLKLPHAQVADDEYESSFDLKSEITLAPGEHLQKAIDALGTLVGMDIDLSIDLSEDLDPLAESPKGTLTIEPAAVIAGDTTDIATFAVELSPVTYVGLQSVDSVQIFRKKPDDAGGFTLEPGPVACSGLAGSNGKKTFECETHFAEEDIGVQTFAAFVHARLFDVPIPVPLEIGVDSVDVQPNVQCGMPDEWDLPALIDESIIEGGNPGSDASITGPNLDYMAVSGAASATGGDSGSWSPSAYLDGEARDYVRVLALVDPSNIRGWLIAEVQASGSASATVNGNQCCGRTGDATAEIEMSSDWLPDVLLKARAGASWSGDLGESDNQTLAETGSVVLGWANNDRWSRMSTYIEGDVRHKGSGNTASVTGALSLTVLDVVDESGASIPVVICSAAGYNYGTFVGAAGPVIASRPVRQAPGGMR